MEGPRLLKNGNICLNGGPRLLKNGKICLNGGHRLLKVEVFELSLTGIYLGGYLIMRQGKIRVPDSLPDRTRKCCGNTFKLVFSHFFVFVGV